MSIKPFLLNVNECVSTRESDEYVEGLDSKVKLELYKTFGKEVRFIRGTFMGLVMLSGTHGLNEELGRHKGRNGMTRCVLCGDECHSESVTVRV